MTFLTKLSKKIFRKKTEEAEDISFPDIFTPLKRLNMKMSATQWLTQDYSMRTMPQTVIFTTTTACNLKCPHCQTHGTQEARKIYNKKRWPDETLDTVAKETLPSAFNFGLTLSGEPLCIPKLGEKIKKFSLYGAKLNLTTNGTLFTKKTFCELLPIVESVSISIDGATKLTCETLRAGSKFKDILTNIQILSRIRDTYFEGKKPHLQLAFTVMASNVKDMPEIIRLADTFKIPTVDFFPVIIFFSHMHGEDLSNYKSLYKAYYMKTKEEMERLNIKGHLPDAYPDETPDESVVVDRSNLIIKEFPENYYENLPSFASFTDNEAIENIVEEVGKSLRQHEKQLAPFAKEIFTPEEIERFGSKFTEKVTEYQPVIEKHQTTIEQLVKKEKKAKYCQYLYTTVFIDIDGVVAPCCLPGRPSFGNIFETPIEEIWNGQAYNTFRKEFNSANPPKCCKNCIFYTDQPIDFFAHQANIVV